MLRKTTCVWIVIDTTCQSDCDNIVRYEHPFFADCDRWYQEVERYGSEECAVFVVGTKSDINDGWKLDRKVAEEIVLERDTAPYLW